MTTKQKQNIARFKAVQAEAKKLKAKNKNLTHVQAVKQAWAILYSKEKKSPAKKKVGAVKKKSPVKKKVGAVKKKVAKKKPSVIKFDTNILAGALRLSPEEKRLGLINQKPKIFGVNEVYKNSFDKYHKELKNLQNMEYMLSKFKNLSYTIPSKDKKSWNIELKRLKKLITEQKTHIKELSKLIK